MIFDGLPIKTELVVVAAAVEVSATTNLWDPETVAAGIPTILVATAIDLPEAQLATAVATMVALAIATVK